MPPVGSFAFHAKACLLRFFAVLDLFLCSPISACFVQVKFFSTSVFFPRSCFNLRTLYLSADRCAVFFEIIFF